MTKAWMTENMRLAECESAPAVGAARALLANRERTTRRKKSNIGGGCLSKPRCRPLRPVLALPHPRRRQSVLWQQPLTLALLRRGDGRCGRSSLLETAHRCCRQKQRVQTTAKARIQK